MYTVLNHPLVTHRVTLMRDRATPPKLFRELVNEITEFLAFEALKDVRMKSVEVTTPVAKTAGALVDEHVVLVPILRAGMGMLDAMLRVLPYAKVPPAKGEELAIVIDPMLATGGSACDAVAQLKKLGYKRIKCLHLVSAPEGIAKFEREHPDVPLYVAARDERLNSHFYIVPGLGDAGDRIFGTL